MPFHKGHLHCLEYAASLCDVVYLLLVLGGKQEEEIRRKSFMGIYHRVLTDPEPRKQQIEKVAAMFDNVIPVVIDVSSCRDENGEESWDMETPIVLEACGRFDAVFGSEPEYAPYFKRAYPWATYELVDPERKEVPISATAVREMGIEEAKQWII